MRDAPLLSYALVSGALLALAGALLLFAFGGLNVAHAVSGDAESPGLNAAFGALFIAAGGALVAVAAIVALMVRRMGDGS